MKNWEKFNFESAPLEIIDGDRGTNYPKQSDFMPFGHCLFLNAGNVTENGFDFSDCSFISKEKDQTLRKGKLSRFDIVLTTRGTVGNLAFYNEKVPYEHVRINSGMVIFRVNQKLIFPRFFYFLLRSNIFNDQVRSYTTGSAQPQLPIRDIKRFTFLLPPLSEQRAIAQILGALDDKIELNRRMSQTLESMARVVFRQWFVESDEAKNWEVQTLDQHVEAERGLSYKGEGLSKVGGMPMHNLNSVYEGGGYKYEGIKYYTGEYKERHIVHAGDIIVTNTEQGFQYLLIGYPAMVPRHFGATGIFSHHIYRVRPLSASPLKTHYLYFLLMHPIVREQIIGCTNGTTVNMLSVDGLRTPKFRLPPKQLIDQFEEFATPIFEKIELLYEESRTLASLRDTLLPRLMRGEVRVSEL